jgi:hypothetical protein
MMFDEEYDRRMRKAAFIENEMKAAAKTFLKDKHLENDVVLAVECRRLKMFRASLCMVADAIYGEEA